MGLILCMYRATTSNVVCSLPAYISGVGQASLKNKLLGIVRDELFQERVSKLNCDVY